MFCARQVFDVEGCSVYPRMLGSIRDLCLLDVQNLLLSPPAPPFDNEKYLPTAGGHSLGLVSCAYLI